MARRDPRLPLETTKSLFAQRRADLCTGRWRELKLAGRDGGMVRILVGRYDLVAVWLKHIGALGKKIVAQVQQQLLENAFHRWIARRQLKV